MLGNLQVRVRRETVGCQPLKKGDIYGHGAGGPPYPVLSEQNKHLYITRNTQEAAQVLMSMYNSLSDLNPVKHYIKTYCLHLLS